MSQPKYIGGIEGGGTKFVCMVGSDPDEIVEEVRFLTTTPSETIDRRWPSSCHSSAGER
jgi:fructokinase